MDKVVLVRIHNRILLSHKRNASDSVLMKWMNLEPVIQTEVSQKEKDEYCILTHQEPLDESERGERGTQKPLDESKVESEKVGSTFRKRRSWHPVPPLHGK